MTRLIMFSVKKDKSLVFLILCVSLISLTVFFKHIDDKANGIIVAVVSRIPVKYCTALARKMMSSGSDIDSFNFRMQSLSQYDALVSSTLFLTNGAASLSSSKAIERIP